MGKKKQGEPVGQVVVNPRKQPLQAISLTIGPWKTLFPNEQNKLLIAKALNDSTCAGHLNIKGYLITKNKLFLVLGTEWQDLGYKLHFFYDSMRKEVAQYVISLEQMGWWNRPPVQPHRLEELLKHPFTRYPLFDQDLVKVLTRKRRQIHTHSPKNYNPRLRRLINDIHNYNFSSALDLTGACGPVLLHGKCDDDNDKNFLKL